MNLTVDASVFVAASRADEVPRSTGLDSEMLALWLPTLDHEQISLESAVRRLGTTGNGSRHPQRLG